jgi:hypothetical protein
MLGQSKVRAKFPRPMPYGQNLIYPQWLLTMQLLQNRNDQSPPHVSWPPSLQ